MPDSMMFETLVDLRDQPFATLEKPTLSSVNLSYSMDELHLNSYFSASRAFEFPERNLVKNSRTQFLAFRRRSMSSPTDPSLQRIESFQQEFEALLQSSASAHSVHSFLKNCRERRGSVSETITTEKIQKRRRQSSCNPLQTEFLAAQLERLLDENSKAFFDIPDDLDDDDGKTDENDCPNFSLGSPKRKNSVTSHSRRVSFAQMLNLDPKIKVTEPTDDKVDSKNVRFADMCGKALAEIKSFQILSQLDFSVYDSLDNLPDFSDLKNKEKSLLPLFFLPTHLSAFGQHVAENHVKLEAINVFGLRVVGSVLVANLSFNKEVRLRYTLNQWETWSEVTLSYDQTIEHESSFDRFVFEVDFNRPELDNKVIFCIKYTCDTGEFWDSNEGINYTLKLVN